MLGSRALVDAVLDDYRAAPIEARDRALFALVEQACADPKSITRADVERVVQAGYGEEAVYDAITVCALFQFYNTWIDATGVPDMPAAAYAMSGKRMAAHGYLPPS